MKMVIREIDEQGRVVIPYEWRKEEGMAAKTKVELKKEDGKILIKPLRYKSFAEIRGATTKKIALEGVEKAEMKAAIKRFKKGRR